MPNEEGCTHIIHLSQWLIFPQVKRRSHCQIIKTYNGRVFNEKIRRRRQKSCFQFKLSVSPLNLRRKSFFVLGFELAAATAKPHRCVFLRNGGRFKELFSHLPCSVAPLPFANSPTRQVVSLKIKIIYRLTINGLDFHLSVACSSSFEMLLIKFNSLLIFF